MQPMALEGVDCDGGYGVLHTSLNARQGQIPKAVWAGSLIPGTDPLQISYSVHACQPASERGS
jgi:hypothetical protein